MYQAVKGIEMEMGLMLQPLLEQEAQLEGFIFEAESQVRQQACFFFSIVWLGF